MGCRGGAERVLSKWMACSPGFKWGWKRSWRGKGQGEMSAFAGDRPRAGRGGKETSSSSDKGGWALRRVGVRRGTWIWGELSGQM